MKDVIKKKKSPKLENICRRENICIVNQSVPWTLKVNNENNSGGWGLQSIHCLSEFSSQNPCACLVDVVNHL